jgi:uncharacterized protein YlzI (FlbEa/FlbD family)
MSRCRKAAATLAVLLAFGTASAALADADSQTVYSALLERPASMSTGRIGVLNDVAKPLRIEENASSAASELRVVESAALRRDGIAGRSRVWIRLTEPGGKSIHINLEHVTAVRSDTQIPGAKAQLDLTSGKFQAVQENVEQVMQLIFATQGAAGNDEPDDVM